MKEINEIKGVSALRAIQKVDYISKYLLNLSKYPAERESIVLNIKKPLETQSEEVINGVLGYMVYSIKIGLTSKELIQRIFREVKIDLKQGKSKLVNYKSYIQ